SPYLRKPTSIDWPGLCLMVVGFGALQLMLDQGERADWFESSLVILLAVIAAIAIVGFLARELTAQEPILNLTVFNDRNFAVGSVVMATVGLGFYSSTVLLALYTQTLMGYDAWTSGLVLAPGGLGNMIALLISGRLVARVDQRLLLGFGIFLNVVAFFFMTSVTLDMDYMALALPRFIQGFGQGFVFVPLQTLALATIRMERLGNATSAYNVVRNLGGSMGIALSTTLPAPPGLPLARPLLRGRTKLHQTPLGSSTPTWTLAPAARLKRWNLHFLAQGSDTFTAQRRGLAMLYQDLLGQARVLAFSDVYFLLVIL